MSRTIAIVAGLTAFVLIGLAAASASIASAASLVVNTTGDTDNGGDSVCSLREAITAANSDANYHECTGSGFGAETITFSVSGTITLGTALPTISDSVTVDGSGQSVTISGNDSVRIFNVISGKTLELNRLVLTDGKAPDGIFNIVAPTPGEHGGAIYNAGVVRLMDVRIKDSKAGTGGSTLNGAGGLGGKGGAIYNAGTLIAGKVTLDHNSAGTGGTSGNGHGGNGGDGGAIYNAGGGSSMTVSNTTLYRNTIGFGGAGTTPGLQGDGTAFAGAGGSSVFFTFTTFMDNTTTTGHSIYVTTGDLNLMNTIIGCCSTPPQPNCFAVSGASIDDLRFNLEDGGSCGFSVVNDSKPGTAPGLDPAGLQNNGGFVPTIALEPGSAALDVIPESANFCGDVYDEDARGSQRPSNTSCDIGAFEAFVAPTPTSTPTNTATPTPTATPTATPTRTAMPGDDDNDEVPSSVENGAPGGGDGNNDGTPDSAQPNVASLPNAVNGDYLTLVAPSGFFLDDVAAVPNPAPGDPAISGVSFPIGFIEFELSPMPAPPAAVTLSLLLESAIDTDTYWRYGPVPANPVDHWYRFSPVSGAPATGATGATFVSPTRIDLRFVDGARGDDDLTVNGVLVDQGGPGSGSPTAVELLYTRAIGLPDGAIVVWETVSEIDTLSFEVLSARSADGPFTPVNTARIPATGSAAAGARYLLRDRPGEGEFYYRVVDVAVGGKRSLSSAVRVVVGSEASGRQVYLPSLTPRRAASAPE